MAVEGADGPFWRNTRIWARPGSYSDDEVEIINITLLNYNCRDLLTHACVNNFRYSADIGPM